MQAPHLHDNDDNNDDNDDNDDDDDDNKDNDDDLAGAPTSMEQPLPMSLPPLIPAHSFRPGPGGPEEFPGAPFTGDGPLPRPGSPDRSPNPSNNAG